jgi:transglutaminase-like putative cysteine protease
MSVGNAGSLDFSAVSDSGIEMAAFDILDHEHVEWERVRRTAFLIHQHFRYDYPGPIQDLHHRLVIVPPERHLDQRRLLYRLDVSAEEARVATRLGEFGNLVLHVHVPVVAESIDFEAWIVAERRSDGGYVEPASADAALLQDPRLLDPSPRTLPDKALRSAADELRATGGDDIALAGRINTWVYERMRYAHDVTDIHTTAAEALARGHGVCQDYAHIMIALCRLCGLPARYVSGHLLGEGGTHAWVEVLIPDASGVGGRVHPFDPTHNRRPGLSYVTVAVGRDYADVAPTSGTYRATYGGRLSSRKSVDLTGVDYSPED